MRARRSWIGWGIVMGLMGSPVWSAEPDSDAVRQLMKKYEPEPGAKKPPPASKPQPKPVPKPQPKPAPVVDHDREAWRSAERCGTAACFQAYLEEYPKGRYARMARARLEPMPKPSTPAPVESGVVPEMVRIKGGCFQMGSPETEDDRMPYETQHRVCVKDFEIGVYEVTQGQWQAVMGSNPAYFKKGDDYPVEEVSWNDVQTYLSKLNQKTGRNYRLPTEAEWEYACRGGVAGQTYCGSNDVDRVAWYAENSGPRTHPVGRKAANGYGLYDMSGNVWEWTCSLLDLDYGGAEQKCSDKDTSAPLAVRGGAWGDTPARVRSAARGRLTPPFRDFLQGFRLARSL